MTLSDDEKEAVRAAIEAVRSLNIVLANLRLMKIACNIREEDGRWFLDAKAILLREHYSEDEMS